MSSPFIGPLLVGLPMLFVCCWNKVTIRVRDGKKLTHEGIKVEFAGSIGQCSLSFTLPFAWGG
jgi:hypothetical protein